MKLITNMRLIAYISLTLSYIYFILPFSHDETTKGHETTRRPTTTTTKQSNTRFHPSFHHVSLSHSTHFAKHFPFGARVSVQTPKKSINISLTLDYFSFILPFSHDKTTERRRDTTQHGGQQQQQQNTPAQDSTLPSTTTPFRTPRFLLSTSHLGSTFVFKPPNSNW
jgi:hypothetical protein